MRRALVACLVVALAATSARAQDAQTDATEQMIRDAEKARQNQIERALGAPAKAFAPIERQGPAPAPRPQATWTGQSSIPWTPILCVAGGLVLLSGVRGVWRWAGRESPSR